MAELEKLFLKRFGSPQLPDDDCGIECAALMLHHLAFRIDPERRMNLWLSAWCWWMSTTQRAALIQFVLSRPRTFSADALAIEMNVHFHEREELGLRTIGAVDFLKADRERRRKEKDRQRKAKERRAAGAVSRTENAAKSKPWNVLGVSKATYYRRKKEALKA